MNKTNVRNSGVELLKVFAMLLIILSHFSPEYIMDKTVPWYFDTNKATSNISYFIVDLFKYGGVIGNTIFIVCSSYFMVNTKKQTSKNKIIHIVSDVWFVSAFILLIYLCFNIKISKVDIIRSIFPISTNTNWFIICYLVLYCIHSYLNVVICELCKNRRRFNLIMILIIYFYSFISVFLPQIGKNYSCDLICFVLIYFIVAYYKEFLEQKFKKRIMWVVINISSIVMLITSVFITNLFGLKNAAYSNHLQHWVNMMNPIIIIFAISAFGMMKGFNFQNRIINRISSVTLIIYVLHENLLFRKYTRQYFFEVFYNWGYQYLPIYILMTSIIVLLLSSIIAIVYKSTICVKWNRFSYIQFRYINNHFFKFK